MTVPQVDTADSASTTTGEIAVARSELHFFECRDDVACLVVEPKQSLERVE